MPPPIETQMHPVESRETLSKTYFEGSYLTVIHNNLKFNSTEWQKHRAGKVIKYEQ